MRKLKTLKRSLAFLLATVMLLSSVDSFSLASFAESYSGPATIAEEYTEQPGDFFDVSKNSDDYIDISSNDVSENAGSTEPEAGAVDVSSNISFEEISDNNVGPYFREDNLIPDVSEGDLESVSGNEIGTDLLAASGKRETRIYVGPGMDYDGDSRFEGVDCYSLSEAKQATRDLIAEMIEAGVIQPDKDYYGSLWCPIEWEIKEDLYLPGNDDFMDEEGLAKYIYVRLNPVETWKTGQDEYTYPDIYVLDGAKIDTCVEFDTRMHYVYMSEGFDGLDYWGDRDGLEGCKLVLGSESTFRLHTDVKQQYGSVLDDFWTVEDPNGNATFIVGSGVNVDVLHFGSSEHKVGKLIIEGADDLNKGGSVNEVLDGKYRCGLVGYEYSYWDSDSSQYRYWDEESFNEYVKTLPIVATFYVKDVEVRGSAVEDYSGNPALTIQGTAEVDSMKLYRKMSSEDCSSLTIKNLEMGEIRFYSSLYSSSPRLTSNCGEIDLRGNITVTDRLETFLEGESDEWGSVRIFKFKSGNLYLPKTINVPSVYTSSGYLRYVPEICIFPGETYETERDGYNIYLRREFEEDEHVFYIEGPGKAPDYNTYRKFRMEDGSGYEDFHFGDAEQVNGKTYYPAVLGSTYWEIPYVEQKKSFWYAYADANGEFPEYTPEHTGLTKWPTDYDNFDDLMEGLSKATFDKPGNVKVYIYVPDYADFTASGSEVTIGGYGNPITDIEFVGKNSWNDAGYFYTPSQIRFVNATLSNDDPYMLNCLANVTFRNITLYLWEHGNKLVINAADYDATFINVNSYALRYKFSADSYGTKSGLPKVIANTMMVINESETMDNWTWRGFCMSEIEVLHLILDNVSVYAPFQEVSTTVKNGMDIDFLNGAQLSFGDYSSKPQSHEYNLGTITVYNSGDDETYYPIETYEAEGGDKHRVAYTIEKLIVTDGSRCNFEFSEKSYTEYCKKIDDLVVGKNAVFTTGDYDGLILSNLTVKENGFVKTGEIKVTGDTVLTDGSKIQLKCSGWTDNNNLENPEFNTITLVKSADSEAERQLAYLCREYWSYPVYLENGIKSESGADETGLMFRYVDEEGKFAGILESSATPLVLLYSDESADPNKDLAYISMDAGDGATQTLEPVEGQVVVEGFTKAYNVRPLGVNVFAAQKGDAFEKAKLVSSFTTYDDAIEYINTSGNANMQYYVQFRENVSFKRALPFPKVGAGFGLVGEGDEIVTVNVTGNITLPINFSLQNIELVTNTKNATLNLNGKDLLVKNSFISLHDDEPIKITGTAGNLHVVNTKCRDYFLVAAGDVSFKSLNLKNAFLYMDGKITVSGDVKLNGSHLGGVKGNCKINGNLYMESSCLRILGGTFEVAKNMYGFESYVQPLYEDWGIYFKLEYMYMVLHHKDEEKNATPINITVKGSSYIEGTQILVTGNVSLGTVYSGKKNMVYYGTEKANTFTVKSVTSVKFEGTEGYGYNDGFYEGSADFEWVNNIKEDEGRNSSYKTVGKNCSDSFSKDELYSVSALVNAIDVRRAYIEKDYYKEGYLSFDKASDVLKAANNLAQLYKEKAAENIAIVTTTDTTAKFVVGRKDVYENGLFAYTASIYSLKTTGNALVIDDTVGLPVVLTNSAEQLIGRFATLNDAFARITALKNAAIVYEITIKDDAALDTKITTIDAALNIPKATAAKQIIIKGEGGATLRFKDALVLNTNVTFENLSFELTKAPAITLNGYGLTFKDCESFFAMSVKGTKNSALKIDNVPAADDDDDDKYFMVLGDITGVDELSLNNIYFKAYGKATVGKLVLFDKAGTGVDKVRLDVALNTGKTKVTFNEDVDLIKGEFDFAPKFTVSGEIDNRGGEEDIFTVLPTVQITVNDETENRTDNINVYKYVDSLYKAAGGEDASKVFGEADWEDYVANGLPILVAPKAEVSYDKLKLDETLATNDVGCEPKEEGMLLKKFAGNTTYLCYSSAEYAPYTLKSGDAYIADFMTWAELVKSVNALAVKRDYTVVLNAEQSPDDKYIINETPETLTMPSASAASSLHIKARKGVADWRYLGDKITLTVPTTLENINFVGRIYNKTKDSYDYIDEKNANVLTVSMPVKLTISGEVYMGGRDTIFDGGKKGTLVLASNKSKLRKETEVVSFNVYGIGAIKNLLSIELNGGEVVLEPYYTTIANAKVGKKTAPEFSATNVEMKTSGELIKLESEEGKQGGSATITNLTFKGDFSKTVNVSNGKLTVTNFKSTGGYLEAFGDKASIAITNMTVGESLSDEEETAILSPTITVSGKTVINNDKLFIGFYKAGSLKLNGAITVADGCYIMLEPVDTDAGVGPYTFAVAPKATSASIFKPAAIGASGPEACEYDGTDDDEFFLVKKGNNILGYKGSLVKAAVYSEVDKTAGIGLLGYYVSYDDAIASMTDKTKDYCLEINEKTSSLEQPVKLTAPAAAKAKSLTIFSKDGDKLYYSAAPSFANNVTLMNIELAPVKSGKATAYPITVSGAKTLTFARVEADAAVTNITAIAGTVEMVSLDDFEATGTINVANLTLVESTLRGNKLTVSKNFVSTDSTIVYNDFNDTIALTNVEVADSNDLTIKYARTIDAKGTDKGVNLNIKGSVTGRINLEMHAPEGDPATMKYSLKSADVKSLSKAVDKVWLNAKNVEISNIYSFKYLQGSSVRTLIVDNLAKANGMFYYPEEEVLENAVWLNDDTMYLDLTQAVNRINEIGDITRDYVIVYYETISDTQVTDSIAHSKLTLPGDNKANKVTIRSSDPEAYESMLNYSSSDAVTVYGTLELDGVYLHPVDSKTGSSPMKPTGSITLKANSKTKVSELILSHTAEIPREVNALTGVSNVSVLVLTDEISKTATSKLTNFREIVLNGSILEAANMSGIGKVVLNGHTSFYVYGKSTLGDMVIGAGAAPHMGVSYNVAKDGTMSSNVTIAGTVINNSDNKVTVALFSPVQTVVPYTNEDLEDLWVVTPEEAHGIPMVLAKKADASDFIPVIMDDEEYISNNSIISYKNLKGEIIADSKDKMEVELYLNNKPDAKTYAKSWSDAVATIDNYAAKEDFTVKILKDKVNAGKNGTLGAMVTPKAASVKSLTVDSDDQSELAYTGALNPTCDIFFDNVRLQEYANGKSKAAYGSSINMTSNAVISFTAETVNSGDELTFNTISVTKGTLGLDDKVDIYVNGAINAANVLIEGSVEIIPVAAGNKYAKQTYGNIKTKGRSYESELTLTNCFTKAAPTTAVSQLSITGKVAPDVKIEMTLKNAQYEGTTSYKLSTNPTGDSYEAMDADYVEEFLEYKSAAKAPVTKTSVLAAPYLDASRLKVVDLDDDYAFYKISGNFYAVAKEGGKPVLKPVVTLETDIDPDGDDITGNDTYEYSADFLTWEAAVTELNKVTNDNYKYKMTLLTDIGSAVAGRYSYKVGKEEVSDYGILSIDRATIPMPAKVKDLTIDGNHKSFVFSGTGISFDSNVVLDDVTIYSLSKQNYPTTLCDSNDKPYKVTLFEFNNTEKLKISVSKGRKLTLRNYRGFETNLKYVGEDGSVREQYTGGNYIGSFAGAAGSKLVIEGGNIWLNGKITGFDEVELKNDAHVNTLYYSEVKYPQATGLTANNLIITNSELGMYGGPVNVKTATLTIALLSGDTLTANEVNLDGAEGIYNYLSFSAGKKGSVNIKKINVNSKATNTIEGRQTAKGASQITINAVNFAAGCEGNKIQIAVANATGWIYAALYNGQTVVNCPGTVPVSAFTLYLGETSYADGHMCGKEGIDWIFERGAGNKNVVFKVLSN